MNHFKKRRTQEPLVMVRSISIALSLALCASGAFAQGFNALALNELYVSHAGADDYEFIEIVGPAGTSLDNVVVCVVEGEVSSAEGTLDRAYDLSGMAIPADGYFVFGDTAVVNLDLDMGASFSVENGTETFYLIQTGSTAATASLVAAVGSVVGSGTGIATTILGTFGTIVDIVGMQEGGSFGIGDVNYDGAPVLGPDGTYLPAGIFRDGDFPGPWCQRFLDFDYVANVDLPRTPGTSNTSCPCYSFLGFNGNGVLGLEVCPDVNPAGPPVTATYKVSGAPVGPPVATIWLLVDVAIAPPGIFVPDGAQYVFPLFPPIILLAVAGDAAGEYTLTIPAGPLGVFSQAFVLNPSVTGGIDVSNVVSF
jgi:hypothetical protein